MTREQAKREIVSLDFYLLNHTDDYGEESHTAMMMAINALEELPKRRKEAKRWKTKAMQNNSCDDAISRQAMHIELEKWITYGEYKYSNATKYLYDRIDRLPSVTPKQRWIPVSERLPETNDDVLVCDGIDMFVAWYSWEGPWQGWNSSDYNFERDTPIIAWMPLPEPYKAESEDKE